MPVIFLLAQPIKEQVSRRGAMWRATAAGVLLSLAFFSKQQAVLAIALVVLWCLWNKMPIPSLAALLLGLIVPTVGLVMSAVIVNGPFAVMLALLVAVTFFVPGAAGAPDHE